MNTRFQNARRATLLAAMMGFAASATLCSAAVSEQGSAGITVIASSDTTAMLQFNDAAGGGLVLSFARETVDDHWLPTSDASLVRGVVFGKTDPILPTIARLRNRQIDPAEVVKEFDLGIADETFDDLTIYQIDHGEMAIALENDGLITAVYYAGQFIHIVNEAIALDVDLCVAFQFNCCLRQDVEVEGVDGDGNPVPIEIPDVPTPHLPSCGILMQFCPILQTDACDCLADACTCSYDPAHNGHEACLGNNTNQQACIDYCILCQPGCPPESDDDDDGDDSDDDGDDDGDEDDNPLQEDLQDIIDLLERLLDLLSV